MPPSSGCSMSSNVTFHRPPPSRLTPGSVGVVSPPSVVRKENTFGCLGSQVPSSIRLSDGPALSASAF